MNLFEVYFLVNITFLYILLIFSIVLFLERASDIEIFITLIRKIIDSVGVKRVE